MPDNISRVLSEHPTCDTLAGLSATRMDIKLAPPFEVGDLGSFAGYRVVRQIGSGGMGLVYEAVDPALERAVALKVLKPRYAANAQAVTRFLAEGKAAAAIVDDHVVTIYQVNQFEGLPFLTMELLTGCSLHQHALGKAVAPATAARVAREIATGLRAVHAAKLVHRDVKPENIWLDARTGRVRLLDFGLALRPANIERAQPAEGLIGTPAYMSPEQVASRPIDARSDLFSLGVVLYELLAGRRPFAGTSLRDTLHAIETDKPEPLRDVPERLAKLTHQLLAKTPADRPASADAVITELTAIEAMLAPAPTSAHESAVRPAAVPAARSPGYPLRTVIVLSTIIALVLIMILVLLDDTVAWVVEPTEPPAAKAAPPKAVAMFDGASFKSWHPAQGDTFDAWTWDKGILRGTPNEINDQLLLTDKDYADFELDLDYRWPEKGSHTSVMFQAGKEGIDDDGFHVNIGDDENFPAVHNREIGDWYRTGSIYMLGTTTQSFNKPIGEWNHLRVQSNKQKVLTEINGNVVVSLNLKDHAAKKDLLPALGRSKGSIGLKVHWGVIEFRDVRIRLLGE